MAAEAGLCYAKPLTTSSDSPNDIMTRPVLIDSGALASLLRHPDAKVLVVDCRYSLADRAAGRSAYEQGHIPGAVYADLEELLSGPITGTTGRHPLPEPETFAEGLAALGASDDTTVIAYDAGDSMFAARLWWMLRWIGHEDARVLDGGLAAWVAGGGALSTEPAQHPRGSLGVRPQSMPTLAYADVLANLETGERQVVDARSPDRYRGENETIDPVGGHIPGALNRFFKDNLEADGRFKTPGRLREEFSALLGSLPPERVVHQCGSGVTACHNLLAMEIAGLHGSALYPGSWSEWCNQSGAPIARG